jgi:hypothetical protein
MWTLQTVNHALSGEDYAASLDIMWIFGERDSADCRLLRQTVMIHVNGR